MDEIKQRLKEASDACIATYEAWSGKPGDASAREALQEAVHELRKVGARLEIELAVSDRKTQGSEPIPIPSHRASRRPAQGADLDMDEGGGNRIGGRGDRQPGPRLGGQQGGGARGSVQIRRPQEGAADKPAEKAEKPDTGNEAGGEDDGQRRSKPLSLKRSEE